MERALWLRFDTDAVVHGSVNPLLAAEIAFSGLDGNGPEKKLNQFQLSARSMAQLRARTPQIMRRYMGEPEFSCVPFYNVPDDSFRYAVAPRFVRATDTSEQSAGRNSGFSRPQLDGGFDPLGHRHGRIWPPLPTRLTMAQCSSRCCKCVNSRSASSRRRSPQPNSSWKESHRGRFPALTVCCHCNGAWMGGPSSLLFPMKFQGVFCASIQ